MKALAKKAGIIVPPKKQLTVHAFRKLFISTGKNVGVSDDVIRALCGKSVDRDIRTYMTGVQWREAFSKIAEQLKIQVMATKNHARLEELEERNKKLEDRVMALDLALDIALKRLAELDPKFKAKGEEMRRIMAEKRAPTNNTNKP